jgi:regulator of PEP synthase PpsR (kinase-PPPase family)
LEDTFSSMIEQVKQSDNEMSNEKVAQNEKTVNTVLTRMTNSENQQQLMKDSIKAEMVKIQDTLITEMSHHIKLGFKENRKGMQDLNEKF